MTRFRVVHRTVYQYGSAMADGFTIVHLAPRATPDQSVLRTELRVTPDPDEIEHTTDDFGNAVTVFAVHRAHDVLQIESDSEVLVEPGLLPIDTIAWEDAAAQLRNARGDLAVDVAAYLGPSPLAPLLAELAGLTSAVFTPGRSLFDAVRDLCRAIFVGFRFEPGFTDVTTPLHVVLAERRGVCQDFAHVGIAALRSLGLAAKYVSGYIETVPPPGEERLVGVDASHAWCSVWVPGHGWLDFDPTNDQVPPQRHVTVGWGRDYTDVAPVRGVVIGPAAGQRLEVAVDVMSLD